MQQPITRREVYEPSLTATIGGREIELESASMDRALPDPLVGGTLTAASGDLVALEGPDVTDVVATPWDPSTQWPPVPETPASVSMDMDSGPVSLLTNGRVISASGGTSDRSIGIEVADQYQSLDRSISWEPVASAMPPLEWDWSRRRYVGLNGVAVTDAILRHCGWYSTPPRLQWIGLSVTGQGSMWPEIGTAVHCGRRSLSDLAGYPVWLNAPWGVGVSDFEGDYRIDVDRVLRERGHLEMTALTTAPSDYSRIELSAEGGAGLARLTWTASQVRIEVRGSGGAFTNAVTVLRTDGLAYATITHVSDTSVRCTIRSGPRTATETVSVASAVSTSVVRNVRIVSTGASAGFQVAFPDTAGRLEGWTPNARIYPRTSNRNHLDVRPSVEGANCAQLLAEQCEAEAATYWIDETGVLQWWDLARLEARSSVATLNSDDDIAESGFTWSHSLSSVKSRAAVKWSEPLREWKAAYGVTFYQGSGKTMQPGDDNVEEWLNTPDDEVWIMPDVSVDRLGIVDMTDFNYGHGTASGAVVAGSGDDADRWADQITGTLITSIERVTDRAFRMHTSWSGNVPVVMRTPSEGASSSLWRVRRNFDLPIFRGKAKFMLAERNTYSTQDGPETAPEHGIDAGWWIQDADQAQYTADYYGQRVTIPQPVLSSIALIPVPGLQLGDMVTVRDEHVTRLTIRGLVVEDSRSINADMDMAHAVAVRPLYVVRNGVTWEEWGAVMAGKNRTWQGWGESQQPKTWEQWGNDPLDGEVT